MTSTYNSKKQFKTMFLQSLKPASVMAILAFLCFSFFTWICSPIIEQLVYGDKAFDPTITGFFWNDLRYGADINVFPNLAFIFAGVVNATALFNFAWSKKQTNVIFSFGMKRSDIYTAKMLGGLLPMFVSILAAGIIETLSCAMSGYEINARFIAMATLTMFQFFAIYALSFVLCSAVIANSGNVVEGLIFTLLLSLSVSVLASFLNFLLWDFTHGAFLGQYSYITDTYAEVSLITYDTSWNWSSPFWGVWAHNEPLSHDYFNKGSGFNIELNHWSYAISAVVYAVIVFFLGLLGFNKRKNEIAGTWGRAKGLNEIVAAVAGFYGIYLATATLSVKHGDGTVFTYIAGCGGFIIVYIFIKLIFGYKRKKEVKQAFNRFPAYAAVYAAVCLVFSLGLFGYSSEIPEASEIVSVTVTSPTYKFIDDTFADSSYFGLKAQNLNQSYEYNSTIDFSGAFYKDYAIQPIEYTDSEDIAKVLKIHKAFIDDGKIKNSGAHSCGTSVFISYKLKNGETVNRYYTETTEGTAQKLIELNETKAIDEALSEYFHEKMDVDIYRDYLWADTDDENYLKIISKYQDMMYELYDYGAYTDIKDGYFVNSKAELIITQDCYLFPKDMTKGFNIGLIDNELYQAIATDIKTLSSKQYYQHSGADEIGVLSFGLSSSDYAELSYNGGSVNGGSVDVSAYYGGIIDDEVYEDKVVYGKYQYDDSNVGSYGETSWNLNSRDIKTVVITKDMTNTIEYLEKNDLMKYLTNTRDKNDVKSVKLCSLGELYDKNNKSYNYPVFYSAYWMGEQLADFIESGESVYFKNYFADVDNQITDRQQISLLLEDATLFGLCSNDSKIMEITYKDGSVQTVMVPAGSEGLR